MKIRPSIRVLIAMLVMACLSPFAMAVGTPAGTAITNRAQADYNDANGNALPTVYSNTVTTIVSQVAAVDVTPDTSNATGPQGTTVSFSVSVVNNGNGPDTFDLATVNDRTWTTRMYLDANGNGIRDAGEDTLVTSTTLLAADATFQLILEVDIPALTPINTAGISTLTATSQFDGTVSDAGVYTATTQDAALTVTKFVVDSPAYKPGDVITYAIEGANTGTAPAQNVVITDAIPANTTYVPGSIRFGTVASTYATAAAMTDAVDADGCDFNITNPGKVTMTWGEAKPAPDASSSGRIYFQVTINANVPIGTGVSNIAQIDYSIGGNAQPPIQSTSASFNVENLPGVDLSTTVIAKSANPGDVVTYPLVITNTGNAADVIDLTYTSSSGLVWQYWVDTDGGGIAGDNGDYLLTDTDGDGKIDTGSLNQNQSLSILVKTTIPAGSLDQSTDTLTITGTSSNDTNVSDTQSYTTTITAPILAVIKEVAPLGNQPPGTELTYTVTATNNGTGVATSVIISDFVPQFTTYVPASIKTGSSLATLVARSDAADADGAHYDTGNNAVVNTAVSLGAGGVFIIQFKVTIDN